MTRIFRIAASVLPLIIGIGILYGPVMAIFEMAWIKINEFISHKDPALYTTTFIMSKDGTVMAQGSMIYIIGGIILVGSIFIYLAYAVFPWKNE